MARSGSYAAASVLGSALYDPAAAATKATDALLAMTALDTTNLRVTFTAPASGSVYARLLLTHKGSGTLPATLLGILDGATVKARGAPRITVRAAGVTTLFQHEGVFLVTGLTPGQSYTWDAAYGVEVAVASTAFGWGGPNNNTANDAYGAASFEVWDAPDLLAGAFYDPAAAVAKSCAAAIAMTALDTTNLRLTFQAPASGRVLAQLRCIDSGSAASSPCSYLLGVLDGATVKLRAMPLGYLTQPGTLAVSDHCVRELLGVVAGLTPGQSYTWDAAYGVEFPTAGSAIRYGGPDDATTDNAYGGFAFMIWAA